MHIGQLIYNCSNFSKWQPAAENISTHDNVQCVRTHGISLWRVSLAFNLATLWILYHISIAHSEHVGAQPGASHFISLCGLRNKRLLDSVARSLNLTDLQLQLLYKGTV